MFVEVFRRLDNIQRLAQDIVSNSDFKFRPPYLRNYYKRSYRDPKDRGSTRRNESQKVNGQKVRVKKRIIDLEKGVILAKKA